MYFPINSQEEIAFSCWKLIIVLAREEKLVFCLLWNTWKTCIMYNIYTFDFPKNMNEQ